MEDRTVKIIYSNNKTKKKWIKKACGTRNNIFIMGIPEGEEKRRRTEVISKVMMAENYPKVEIEIDTTSKRPKEPQIGWTQIGLHWDILLWNCQK